MNTSRKPTVWRRVIVEWERQHKYLTWYVAITCTVIIALLLTERGA